MLDGMIPRDPKIHVCRYTRDIRIAGRRAKYGSGRPGDARPGSFFMRDAAIGLEGAEISPVFAPAVFSFFYRLMSFPVCGEIAVIYEAGLKRNSNNSRVK